MLFAGGVGPLDCTNCTHDMLGWISSRSDFLGTTSVVPESGSKPRASNPGPPARGDKFSQILLFMKSPILGLDQAVLDVFGSCEAAPKMSGDESRRVLCQLLDLSRWRSGWRRKKIFGLFALCCEKGKGQS